MRNLITWVGHSMDIRMAAPRFSAIYIRQGRANWVQHELKQIITGLGPPLLYAVDDEQGGRYGVVLTDRDVDTFWNTQPDCRMPDFPNTSPKRPFRSLLAHLWPPNYWSWAQTIASTHQTRRELADDLIGFPETLLSYVRAQQTDADGEPLQQLVQQA